MRPLLLISSDLPHLITPIQPVCTGPQGSPVAIRTRLGRTLQGPTTLVDALPSEHQCMHISTTSPTVGLLQHFERLWQADTLPYINEKLATRSKQDQQALLQLETSTTWTEVNGVHRYYPYLFALTL